MLDLASSLLVLCLLSWVSEDGCCCAVFSSNEAGWHTVVCWTPSPITPRLPPADHGLPHTNIATVVSHLLSQPPPPARQPQMRTIISASLRAGCCAPQVHKSTAYAPARLAPVRIAAQPKEVFPGTRGGRAQLHARVVVCARLDACFVPNTHTVAALLFLNCLPFILHAHRPAGGARVST